jgi:hypothetical protein
MAKRLAEHPGQSLLGPENICEHVQSEEWKIGQVIEAMVQKLVDGGKAVTDFKTP